MKKKKSAFHLRIFHMVVCNKLSEASMIDEWMNASLLWLHIQTWLTDYLRAQDGLQTPDW